MRWPSICGSTGERSRSCRWESIRRTMILRWATARRRDRATEGYALTSRSSLRLSLLAPSARSLTIGDPARLRPEKGLHVLADAFIRLKQMPGMERPGCESPAGSATANRHYAEQVFARLREAGLGEAFEYVGEVDRRRQDRRFSTSLDVLAVPTTYREPKGLFVLEAPGRGRARSCSPITAAFPEVLAAPPAACCTAPKTRSIWPSGARPSLFPDAQRRPASLVGWSPERTHRPQCSDHGRPHGRGSSWRKFDTNRQGAHASGGFISGNLMLNVGRMGASV